MKAALLFIAIFPLTQAPADAWKIWYGDCGEGYFRTTDTNPTDPSSPPDYEFYDKSDTLKLEISDGAEEFDPVSLVDTLLAYVDSAAATWNAENTEITIDVVTDWGHTVADGDGRNSIIWVSSIGGDAAGLVSTTVKGQSGECSSHQSDDDFAEILDTDIEFNDEYAWRKNKMECGLDPNSSTGDELDIWSIAVHEMGHSLGIAHSETTSNCPTMLSGGQSCSGSCENGTVNSLELRSLASDDQNAVGFLYDATNSVLDSQGDGQSAKPLDLEARVPTLPLTASISNAYPNPFNPSVVIEYEVGFVQQAVAVVIRNTLGQRVAELFSGERNAGLYTARWDGRSGAGEHVASGLYFVEVLVGEARVAVKRITLER